MKLALLAALVLLLLARLGQTPPPDAASLLEQTITSAIHLPWDPNMGLPSHAILQRLNAPPLPPPQLQVITTAMSHAIPGHSYKNHPISGPRTLWRFTTTAGDCDVILTPLRSRDGLSSPWVSIEVMNASDSWLQGVTEYELEGPEALQLIKLLNPQN